MFMGRALELAARGQGWVEPNPMVGCVIVNDGEVVGEGWHRKFGGPHAEIDALKLAGSRARGGTAYVTLEPCCHQGKTGPCTQALITAGVRRVVSATARSVRGSCRSWNCHAGGGWCVGGNRDDGRRSAEAQFALLEASDNRAALGNCQMGHDAGWKNCHAHRRQSLDLRRSLSGNCSAVARTSGCNYGWPRHIGERRSLADLCAQKGHE